MHDAASMSDGLRFDGYVFNASRRSLMKNGVRIELTPRVFDLLAKLIENAGEVVTKDELLATVWSDAVVEEGNVNRTVSTLRRKLGRQSDGSDFIETVPKQGYRFIAPIEAAAVSVEPDRPERGSSPGSQPWQKSRYIYLGLGLALFASLLAAAFVYRPQTPGKKAGVPKNTLIRLTNDPATDMVPTFTSDGRIRFVRLDGKISYSYVMNADGSDVRREAAIPGLARGLWSPDGTKVFYQREGGGSTVFIANADGSDEKQLTFNAGNTSWSPDSKKLVLQVWSETPDGKKNSDIFIYTLASGELQPVVSHPAFDGDPSFAPDARSILFVSDRDGNIEIYRQDLETGNVMRLTDNPGHDSYPSYSPDGTQIVFNSDREGENTDVYLMDSDGGGLKKLTNLASTEYAASNPWSPDGTQLLVISDKDGAENIYLMNVEPFDAREFGITQLPATQPDYLGNNSSLVYFRPIGDEGGEIRSFDQVSKQDQVLAVVERLNGQPSVSPDFKRILFTDFVDDNTEIISISVDGKDRVNLTRNASKDLMPSWSPDGRKIAFSTNRGGDLQRYDIWTMNPDGSDQQLAYRDEGSSVNPIWTPDGDLLFANDRIGGRVGNFELFRLMSAQTTPVRLTDRIRYDVAPSVSSDGKRVVFSSNADGNFEIYMMNTDGSKLLRLTRDAAEDVEPKFSPDGSKIVFASNRSGEFTIYEITL